MAEGLKIQVGADVTQAEKALDKLSREVKQTAGTISSDFNRALNSGSRALDKLPQSSNRATFALTNFGRVVQDAPFGIIGIANNIDPLLLSFQQLKRETGSTSGAFKALGSSLIGGGGLALGVSVVTSLLVVFGDKIFGAGRKVQQAKKDNDEFAESLRGIVSSLGKEASQVTSLVSALTGGGLNPEQRKAALERLKSINTEYFGTLKEEDGIIRNLASAYEQYINQIAEVGRTKAIETQLTKLFNQKLEIELAIDPKFQSAINRQTQGQIAFLERELSRLGGRVDLNAIPFDPGNKDLQRRIALTREIDRLNRGANIIFDQEGVTQFNRELQDINLRISGLTKLLETSKFDIDVKLEPDTTKKDIEDIISQGKRLADELRKIGFIAPEFNFFDTQAQQLEKARQVIRDFQAGNLRIDPNFFKIETDIVAPPETKVKQQLDLLEQAVQKGLINRPIQIPVELSERAAQNARIIQEFQDIAARQGLRLSIPVDLDLEGSLSTTARVLNEELAKTQNRLRFATEGANALSNAFQGLFTAITQGENPLKAFFQAIGQEVLRLISQLIAAQIRALILRAILGGAGGGIGSAAASIGGSITGFAAGGIVSGPTLALVGEGVGTSRSNPEVIAPLDQLRSILESVVAGRGGGGAAVLSARIRGNDLLLSGSRTSRRNRRLGSG